MWTRLARSNLQNFSFRLAFGRFWPTRLMGRRVAVLVLLALVASGCAVLDGSGRDVSGYPDDDLGVPVEVYKSTAQRDLHLHLFNPEPTNSTAGAVLFFHGGGFGSTRVEQFERQAEAVADVGMVGIVVEYRVIPEGTSRSDAIDDGTDAVAYVAANADRLSIDVDRIAVAGSSAGGALAVEASLDADALALFNPAVGSSSSAFLRGQPTVVFHSRQDTIVPFSSAEGFCNAAQDCTMVAFDDGDHGFFNDDPAFTETTEQTIEFLQALGW